MSKDAAESPLPPPPPPSYSAIATPPNIPSGVWDLAVNIDVEGGDLQLDINGKPVWTQDTDAADGTYRKNGFSVSLGPDHKVVNPAYSWICGANTVAGQLLSKADMVSLSQMGGHLFVFEQAVRIKKISGRPPPKRRDDSKDCLKVESESSNVWAITGTDIYEVNGDKDDLVVLSTNFLRLWDTAKGRLRWERQTSGETSLLGLRRIWGFTEKFVVIDTGYIHLYERKTGCDHGNFHFPSFSPYIDFNPNNHFGPVVSKNGLFLYKPCSKALFIFRISAREVSVRIWESSDAIQGSMILVGKTPNWTKHEVEERVFTNGFIKKMIM